jgi:hypothetical protein
MVSILRGMAELRLLFATEECPKSLLALLAGYSHERSTTFSNAIKKLKEGDMVQNSGKGCLRLTQHGQKLLPMEVCPPRDNMEMQSRLLAILRKKISQVDSLDQVFSLLSDGQAHHLNDVVAAAGYNHPRSTAFCKIKAELKRLGLLEDCDKKELRFTDKVFPFGRPQF